MAMTAEERLEAVILRLKNIRPFYSILYRHLKRYEVNSDSGLDTMGVGVDNIIYNKDFVLETELPDLTFVNMHEITHYALMHMLRRGNRHPKIWNYACDLYVNAFLASELHLSPGESKMVNDMPIKMPNNLLYEEGIDIANESAETIYDRIKDNFIIVGTDGERVWLKNPDGTTTDITDLLDNDLQEDGLSEIDSKNKQEQVKRILIEADTKARMAGIGGCSLQREVAKIIAPVVDWRNLVKKYLIEAISRSNSYRTPDRRLMYQEAIFPGFEEREKTSLERVKICVDTSGSVSEEDLGIFHNQITQLLNKYKVGAEVIYWDGKIESQGKFSSKEEFKIVKVKGGGGTTPQCLFEYFDSSKCKDKPVLTIIFTDGYIDFEAKNNWARKYKDTVWIITPYGDKNFQAPFGKTVKFDNYR